MHFDNLMYNDLKAGFYMFIPFLLILLFWLWPSSVHYVIQYVKEFKTHSVETVSEVSQKSEVLAVERLAAAINKHNRQIAGK